MTAWPSSFDYANIVYSALQAKQLELERQQHTDNLRKHLEKRPERDELVEREFGFPWSTITT